MPIFKRMPEERKKKVISSNGQSPVHMHTGTGTGLKYKSM
ncbi:hypothetical protein SP21_53 [Salmonella phage 21]|nr:hypothetical protein SP21_53 [Salmonella phage 21]